MREPGARRRRSSRRSSRAAGDPVSRCRSGDRSPTPRVGRALVGLLALRARAPTAGLRRARRATCSPGCARPGVLERPELADALELEARRAGAARGAEQARDALGGALVRARRDRRALAGCAGRAARARWPSAPGASSCGCSRAPRRGRAPLLERAGDGRGARARRRPQRARGAARARALRPRGRRLRARRSSPASSAELEVNSGELPGPGLVAVLDPLRCARGACGRCSSPACRRACSRLRARPQPLLGDRERGASWPGPPACCSASREDVARRRALPVLRARLPPEELLALSWHETDDDAAPPSRSLFVDDVCDLFDERLSEQRARRALGEPLDAPRPPPRREGRRRCAAADRAAARRARARRACATASGRRRRSRTGSAARSPGSSSALLAPGRLEPDARAARPRRPRPRGAEGARSRRCARETGSARLTPRRSARAAGCCARRSTPSAAPSYALSVRPERAAAIVPQPAGRPRALPGARGGPRAARSSRASFELALRLRRSGRRRARRAERAARLRPRRRREHARAHRPHRRRRGRRGGRRRLQGRRPRPPATRWIADGNLQVALYMQAAEQLLGRGVVGGLYQPLSRQGPAGARRRSLDDHDSIDDCVRTDRLRRRGASRAARGDALDAARAAAGEAARGALAGAAGDAARCGGGCRYPTICRCER